MKHADRIFVLAMLCGGCAIVAEAASFLKVKVALIQYEERSLQPRWTEGGAFFDVLERERQTRQHMDLAGCQNVFISGNIQHEVRKKSPKLTFSPRIFIRPFIIVEELYAFFMIYQSQAKAFVDKNAQVKTMPPFGGRLAHVQQIITSPRMFSFMPYYHKVYGIYLQIIW